VQVEDVLVGERRLGEVAARGVQDALGLAGRARGVQDEEGVLGGERLRGRVLEISPATGSEFSVLPPDNATGNYVKIAQRIPVKIAIDSGQAAAARLRPGMSVVVSVDTAAVDR